MGHPFTNIWGEPSIGKGTKIAAFVEIGATADYPTKIGIDCKIEAFTFIPPGTLIKDRVFIGPHVCFTNDKNPKVRGFWKCRGVVINDDVSIGANVTILPGVIVGWGAILGAGSVVTKDVLPGETWVGNPAKRL